MDLPTKRKISVVIFLLGALVGIIFNFFMVWAQLEASLWNATPTDDEALAGFRCPLIITSGETGTVRIEYENPLNRAINPVIRTFITEGLVSLQQEESVRPDIMPGETAQLEYPVSSENAVWERFIFVRVYALPQYTLPSRSASCGILFLNLPLPSGTIVLALVLIVSLSGMIGGIWMWTKINIPLTPKAGSARWAMIFLASITILGMTLELLGIWGLATAVLLLTFIMMAALIGYFLSAE